MSNEEILQGPIEKLRSGDLDGALADLDEMMGIHKTNAEVHHMFAEFANMKNTEAQEDVIPGGKIMMAYKKAMQMDEENMEYIGDFATFALECRRIPVAVKEFQRYARRLEQRYPSGRNTVYCKSKHRRCNRSYGPKPKKSNGSTMVEASSHLVDRRIRIFS